MKIVISDYAELMNETSKQEQNYLKNVHPEWEVELYPYTNDKEALLHKLDGADALLTAFLPLNQAMIEKMYTVKCISINATGFNTVDVEAATRQKIGVMAIEEYCTYEVAEHTLSLILALSRGIKSYIQAIDTKGIWHYDTGGNLRRLHGQKIGIFGYGRIGQQVARLCQGFGMEIYVYEDPTYTLGKTEGIHPASLATICEECTIITNHMSQNSENHYFFDEAFFKKLKKQPIFINVGRGEAVKEEALLQALKEEKISKAALDVLESENPNLKENPLVKQERVLLTPHAAFYSMESIEALAKISTDNLIYYLEGKMEQVKRLINPQIQQISKEETGE